MTAAEVQERCRALAKRLGPHGSVSVDVGVSLSPYAFVMQDVRDKSGAASATIYGEDWAAIFALVEIWVNERAPVDADAEWQSWQAAA